MIEEEYLVGFQKNSGLEESQLKLLEFPIELPEDYINLLKIFNGGEGEIGEEYLVLHQAEKLNDINADYKIAEFDANLFIIGSNGSGELIAIDARNKNPSYISIPYIFEYDAIIELSTNIEDLFKRIYEEGYFGM